MSNGDKWYEGIPLEKVLQTVGGILLAICSFFLSRAYDKFDALSAKQAEMTERIVAIEANRFNEKDGLAVWQEIARLRTALAKIPEQIPPPEFRARVEEIAAGVRALNERLRTIERDVAVLKNR